MPLKRIVVAAIIILGMATPSVSAEPAFAEYPATVKLSGKPKMPRWDQRTSFFKTRIENGVKVGQNFAGHYGLIEFGCGSSCINAVLIDLNSGTVIDFPLGGEGNYQLQLEYSRRSTLPRAVWRDLQTEIIGFRFL